jgi:hypothetical protein
MVFNTAFEYSIKILKNTAVNTAFKYLIKNTGKNCVEYCFPVCNKNILINTALNTASSIRERAHIFSLLTYCFQYFSGVCSSMQLSLFPVCKAVYFGQN